MHLIAYERRKQELVQSYKFIEIYCFTHLNHYRIEWLDRMETLNYKI